jgi:hypothetical protein
MICLTAVELIVLVFGCCSVGAIIGMCIMSIISVNRENHS